MPIIKSARKRVKVAAKANIRNAKTKRSMRQALKAFASALAAGKSADIAKAQAQAASAIDKAAKYSVIHKNKAARKKAQLAVKAKGAGVKPAKAPAKKAVAKKPVAKKPAAKSTAKKAAPKKTVQK